jgi:hypothetical protein
VPAAAGDEALEEIRGNPVTAILVFLLLWSPAFLRYQDSTQFIFQPFNKYFLFNGRYPGISIRAIRVIVPFYGSAVFFSIKNQ